MFCHSKWEADEPNGLLREAKPECYGEGLQSAPSEELYRLGPKELPSQGCQRATRLGNHASARL